MIVALTHIKELKDKDLTGVILFNLANYPFFLAFIALAVSIAIGYKKLDEINSFFLVFEFVIEYVIWAYEYEVVKD